MGTRLRGVVFDLDGTLVVSHHDFPRMREAIAELASKYGARPEPSAPSERVGTSETMRAVRRRFRALDPTDGGLLRSFDEESKRRLAAIELDAVERTRPREGAAELLERLGVAGLKLAVFTRSSAEFCEAVFAKLGWSDRFSAIRTQSARGPAKPSPVALTLLLEEMGLSPEEVAYVGDHPEDARCAAGLGVTFYAVLPSPLGSAPWSADEFFALGALRAVAALSELEPVLLVPWTLRRATEADVPGLLRCLSEAFEPFRSRYTAGAYEDTTLTEETARERLRAMRVWVATDAAATIRGTAAWTVGPGNTGHLREMAVAPTWQGTGLAQRLLECVVSDALGASVRTMTLETTAPLARAVRFYRRNGFRPTEQVRDYFGMPLYEYARALGGPPNQDGS